MKKQKRIYNTESSYRYSLFLEANKDGNIIEHLNKLKNKQSLIRYAIYCKINRNNEVDISYLENRSINSENKTLFLILNGSINKDLIEVLEQQKLKKQASKFIKQALYELLAVGYTVDEVKEYENICKDKKNNLIIMKPQFTLYRHNEKDEKIAKIMEKLNKDKRRDNFIKDAILEKYNKEYK